MFIEMRIRGLDMPAAIQRDLEERVRMAFRSWGTRVQGVILRLADVNGPRGGADLHCAVSLELIPRGTVRAEANDSDLMVAVARALGRARSCIYRGVGRRRRGRRRPSTGGDRARLGTQNEGPRRTS